MTTLDDSSPIKIQIIRDNQENFIALALNGKSIYDWKYGTTQDEAIARLRSTYTDWKYRYFHIL